MDIAEQKKEIRRQIKAQKAELDAQRKQAMSRQIAEAVEQMPEFAGAQTIIAYWALPDEVDLNDAIVRWASSRAVYLPVMVGRNLEFRQFTVETFRRFLTSPKRIVVSATCEDNSVKTVECVDDDILVGNRRDDYWHTSSPYYLTVIEVAQRGVR